MLKWRRDVYLYSVEKPILIYRTLVSYKFKRSIQDSLKVHDDIVVYLCVCVCVCVCPCYSNHINQVKFIIMHNILHTQFSSH